MMDKATYESLLSDILKKAEKLGFDESQASYFSGISMEVSVLNGEVNSFERSSEQGIRFKGKKNGQMASSVTNVYTDEAIDYMLSNVSESCEILDDEDEDFIYCDPDNKELYCSQITDAFDKNTYTRFESIALKLEKDILASDPAIKAVDYLSISCDRAMNRKINSKGLQAYTDSDFVSIYAGARAEKDGQVKTSGYYWYGNDIDKFDNDEFVKVFKKRIMDKFGGTSVASGKYDIILGNEAVVAFFSTFMSNFSSYSMQKGLSLLAGKEGEVIASDNLNIKEIPLYEKALKKVPFDSEGVATTEKYIIEKGKFNTAFYNLKTANKAGIKSTGNGFGGMSFSNLIIEPGDKSFDELCNTLGNGLYITDLAGLHAGVNTISGDYSIFCEGFRITDGKVSGAVEQITISDNFYDSIRKITDVGNDIYSEPGGAGEFFAPSMIIKDIKVAGEAVE